MQYNTRVEKAPLPREYRPELLPRRGEITAWGLALLVAAAWVILAWQGLPVMRAIPLLTGFLFLAASGISLANWMDRHTTLKVDGAGVSFENGLRHARLGWADIRQVQVFPAAWGKRVNVIGSQAHFSFNTLGEVRVKGEIKGRTGFMEGEEILGQILQEASLQAHQEARTGYIYYTRE